MSTAKRVNEIFHYCLFKDEEIKKFNPETLITMKTIPDDAVIVEGLRFRVGFNSGRLQEKKEEVREILNMMPDTFHKDKGGGMSFLNLCMDKNENLWGQHKDMDELCCLGIAMGMAGYCLPRDMWDTFPGGVPYIYFDTSKGESSEN